MVVLYCWNCHYENYMVFDEKSKWKYDKSQIKNLVYWGWCKAFTRILTWHAQLQPASEAHLQFLLIYLWTMFKVFYYYSCKDWRTGSYSVLFCQRNTLADKHDKFIWKSQIHRCGGMLPTFCFSHKSQTMEEMTTLCCTASGTKIKEMFLIKKMCQSFLLLFGWMYLFIYLSC